MVKKKTKKTPASISIQSLSVFLTRQAKNCRQYPLKCIPKENITSNYFGEFLHWILQTPELCRTLD